MTTMKSIDRRLFEALTHNRGLRLSAEDVEEMLLIDDAIGTRVSNAAADEAGLLEPGESCITIALRGSKMRWSEFGNKVGDPR